MRRTARREARPKQNWAIFANRQKLPAARGANRQKLATSAAGADRQKLPTWRDPTPSPLSRVYIQNLYRYLS